MSGGSHTCLLKIDSVMRHFPNLHCCSVSYNVRKRDLYVPKTRRGQSHGDVVSHGRSSEFLYPVQSVIHHGTLEWLIDLQELRYRTVKKFFFHGNGVRIQKRKLIAGNQLRAAQLRTSDWNTHRVSAMKKRGMPQSQKKAVCGVLQVGVHALLQRTQVASRCSFYRYSAQSLAKWERYTYLQSKLALAKRLPRRWRKQCSSGLLPTTSIQII